MNSKDDSLNETLNRLKGIEHKWQDIWEKDHSYEAEINDRKSHLVTFPYPYVNNALHIGHSFTCNKVDIYSRVKRLQGYNVLFGFAFHATGEPIVGVAKRVKQKDPSQLKALRSGGITDDILEKFSDPEFIANYWRQDAISSAKQIGWGIDWRRQFITIEPLYNKFIEWQYLTLRDRGYIQKGTHNVIYCPACQSPTGDHDRLQGEGATPVNFTLVKYPLKDGSNNTFLVAATFRPETIFGATNVWLNPNGIYVKILLEETNENWIVSKTGAFKLQEQLRKHAIIEEFSGSKYVGHMVINPVLESSMPILPADFVDPEHSSGVVYSVPGHAPLDYLALRDLQQNPSILTKYNVDESIVNNIELISVITTENEFSTEFPAKELVEKLDISNQSDPKSSEATDIVYKKEFHKGVMNQNTGSYVGKKVSEIKDQLIKDFQMVNIVDSKGLWETSEIVICRSNDKCIVKTLENQWFLSYSDPNWKEQVRKALSKMEIYPKEAIPAFQYTIDWLEEKACARKSGMGTKLPWDRESGWIVETLSDSTIYMALYTIIHKIREFNIKPEQLQPNVFNYIYLKQGDAKKISQSSKIPVVQLQTLQNEFFYWYPVALRISAKELIYNHLTYFIFHHVAIWDSMPELWPKKVGAGGMVRIDNMKMSKSTGNFITLSDAIKTFGADALRMGLAYADEGFDDPNFSRQETMNFIEKINSLIEQMIDLPKITYSGSTRHIDLWLANRIIEHVNIVTLAYDRLETRTVVTDALFKFTLDLKWYLRRTTDIGSIYHDALEIVLLLLAPIIPHTAEEIWHTWNPENKSIFSASWPTVDKYSHSTEVDIYETALENLIQDIRNLFSVIKKEITSIDLYIAEEWKYKLLILSTKVSQKNLMKEAMKDPDFKKIASEVSDYLKKMNKLQETPMKINFSDKANIKELEFFKSAIGFLKDEFKDLKINIMLAEQSSDLKRGKRAEPLRPAIYLS